MKAAYIFLMSLFALTGCGTTSTIRGRYVDAGGRGIPGAKVTLWRTSPLMYLAPVLPARVAEAKTDKDGRFEIVAKETANGLSVEGGGGSGSARLWLFSRDLLVEMKPYPPRDYSELNRECPHSPSEQVQVEVGGAVLNPGRYILKASDSAWTAIEAAGGPASEKDGDVELTRKFGRGVIIHYLDWSRRREAIGEPLLCDGDRVVVGRTFPITPLTKPNKALEPTPTSVTSPAAQEPRQP